MPRKRQPPEAALMLPVLRAALRIGWATQMSLASSEIPWHQKRLDLGFALESGLVVVELKIADGRRAVRQAFVNRWVARSSWVALWHENISPLTYELARGAGVGILIVTQRTAYPLLRPGPAMRADDESPVTEEIHRRGTRVRDLLSGALEVHRAAFA